MHEWMDEEKRVEGGSKQEGNLIWSWREEGRKHRGKEERSEVQSQNIFDNTQHSHLDHRAEFAGPQPSHILWN